MPRLYYGTQSWSSKDWIGRFYPRSAEPSAMLERYALEFNAVEADTTYYHTPNIAVVEQWARRTPDEFRMCAKAPRSIVHAGKDAAPNAQALLDGTAAWPAMNEFLKNLAALGAKAGPVLLQFPHFSGDTFASGRDFLRKLEPFLERLPGTFRYAVEIRNRAWIHPDFLNALKQHCVAFVTADFPKMPHPDEYPDGLDCVTADFLYVRLVGNRRAFESRELVLNEIHVDQAPRLQRWANWLAPRLREVQECYVFSGDYMEGYAPETARRLATSLLGEHRPVSRVQDIQAPKQPTLFEGQ